MSKKFEPNFKTPLDEQDKTEANKRHSNGMRGTLHEAFRNEASDIGWEAEQLAKSYGIYLEFNRATSGKEKDWMYMIRLGIPGGGPISPVQWELIDQLGRKHGRDPQGVPALRLTTRQAVQFHWLNKQGVLQIVKSAAENGLLSLNACGDNVRNLMACPLSSQLEGYDSRALAAKIGRFFLLPSEPFIEIFAIDPAALEQPSEHFHYGPQLLNRKFKMAVSGLFRNPKTGRLEADNCVEMRTHDLGLAPFEEDGKIRFQIFLGGGQGEKVGKPTASLLSLPFAVVDEAQVVPVLDAIVQVHQEWGDRQNRHWARIKYLIRVQGIAWFRAQVAQILGYELEAAREDLDPGPRHLHQGWTRQANGRWAFGAFIENGRLRDDSPNGQLLTLVAELSKKFQTPILLTPNQDLIFSEIEENQRAAFEAELERYGYGRRNGLNYSELRRQSGACVGRDTCRLAYTDSEKFEPELLDQLEALGWGALATSIGITGCERQCFRPATKAFGLIGSGLNRYQFKLFGSEDGRHQGVPLSDGEEVYLRSVPRERVAEVLDTLFRLYEAQREPGETPGYFNRRMGAKALIAHLSAHPRTAELMRSSAKLLSIV